MFIVTPPKCGTTWTQEIVWLLKSGIDVEGAKTNQFYRVPFVELGTLREMRRDRSLPPIPAYPEGKEEDDANLNDFILHSVEFARRLRRPRILKSHLPLSLLPDGILDTCKVVFVARNVKGKDPTYRGPLGSRGEKKTF